MHKLILWFFTNIKNIEKTIRLFCILIIMLIAIYWVLDLAGVILYLHGFRATTVVLSPMDNFLNFANSLYSGSFNFWGKAMEVKYFVAVGLLLIIVFCLKIISVVVELLQELYEKAHFVCKKAKETAFNINLKQSVETPEKQKTEYMVYIQVKIKDKFKNRKIDTSIEEQKFLLKKFIADRTNLTPIDAWDGYLYYIKDFDRIDNMLDILQKVINSKAPLDYVICIQVGNDTKQLKNLADLTIWNKLVIAADTLYRYKLNSLQRYKSSSLGVFQKEDGTLEVHELLADQ